MKSLLLCLPLLLCGCLSDAVATSPRQAEFIDLGPSPRTTAVEPSSRVPAVASPQQKTDAVVYLYSADWCMPCRVHVSYWDQHGWKGSGFTVKHEQVLPSNVASIPCYRWTLDGKTWYSPTDPITPDQLQSSFDQTPKAGE